MRWPNTKRPVRTAQALLADAAALVDEFCPLYLPGVSRRVDQLVAAADRAAEQEACC